MLSRFKCRLELAGFRWKRVSLLTQICFPGSFIALVVVGFFVPIPESLTSFISWIIACLFLVFLALMAIGSFRRQAKAINKQHKSAMNSIRRKYGVEEK